MRKTGTSLCLTPVKACVKITDKDLGTFGNDTQQHNHVVSKLILIQRNAPYARDITRLVQIENVQMGEMMGHRIKNK